MKAKIINDKLEDFGHEFKVRRMNYDQIIVNYPTGTGLKEFSFEDIEIISENEIDKFLINNRDFLKIKLKRGISVTFYSMLYEAIKLEIDEEPKNLNILKDKYSINKRGFWEKYILLTVNNIYPLEINATGQNFKRDNYNINTSKIEKNFFIKICEEEVDNILKEIEVKNSIITSFNEAIEYVKSIEN